MNDNGTLGNAFTTVLEYLNHELDRGPGDATYQYLEDCSDLKELLFEFAIANGIIDLNQVD